VQKPAALPFNTDISHLLQHYDPFFEVKRSLVVVHSLPSCHSASYCAVSVHHLRQRGYDHLYSPKWQKHIKEREKIQ